MICVIFFSTRWLFLGREHGSSVFHSFAVVLFVARSCS